MCAGCVRHEHMLVRAAGAMVLLRNRRYPDRVSAADPPVTLLLWLIGVVA